jgi:hypothetical protein
LPVPHSPQEEGVPLQEGGAESAAPDVDAKTENFLVSRVDPHWGQGVPSHSVDRTNTSESFPQPSQ